METEKDRSSAWASWESFNFLASLINGNLVRNQVALLLYVEFF